MCLKKDDCMLNPKKDNRLKKPDSKWRKKITLKPDDVTFGTKDAETEMTVDC
jgi:hypothetical protein